MSDQFYVPSRGEAAQGTTFTRVDPDSHYFVRGSDGVLYTTSGFGFDVRKYDMSERQRAAWTKATGISDEAIEDAAAREATTWGSEQFNRDVAKLHIEADRLGFVCTPKTVPQADTFRRQFDENGLPTGFVINNRTGAMAQDSTIPLALIDIPAPINATGGMTVETPSPNVYRPRERPWWRKVLAFRVRVRFVDVDEDDDYDGI